MPTGDNFFTSPDTRNLPILTGIVSFKPDGDTDFRDLGYVDDLAITVTTEQKQKKAARGGLVKTVFTALTGFSASFKLTLAELTPDNLGMFILGDVETLTDGSKSVEMLSNAQPKGYLQFIADNNFGPQYSFIAYVTLGPAGDMNILNLNGDFSVLPCQGEINADPTTGKYPIFVYPINKA